MATPTLPDQRHLKVIGLQSLLRLVHLLIVGEDVAGAEVGRLQHRHELEELG